MKEFRSTGFGMQAGVVIAFNPRVAAATALSREGSVDALVFNRLTTQRFPVCEYARKLKR